MKSLIDLRALLATAVAAILLSTAALGQTDVIRLDESGASFADQWGKAMEVGSDAARRSGFWVGYRFTKRASSNSGTHIMRSGSWNGYWNDDNAMISDIVAGESDRRRTRSKRSRADHDEKHEWRDREFVALIRYEDRARRASDLDGAIVATPSSTADLDDEPLVWLGKADPEEATQFFIETFGDARGDARETLVAIAASIGQADLAFPFLRDLIDSNEDDDFRNAATLWIGSLDDRRVLPLLEKVARNDEEEDVQRTAVMRISQLPREDAADVLVDLVKDPGMGERSEDAVFWLGQRGGEGVPDLLLDLVESGRSAGVRKKAVFAISQLDDELGIEPLITLARTSDRRDIRKEAIFWLGQAAGDRAIEALTDVVFDPDETEVQEQGVFALSQLSDGEGIPALIDVAKEHPNGEVRKKAIFWLGQSGDDRALELIESILLDGN